MSRLAALRGNKIFRRLILLWVMVLITVLIVWTWLRPPDIPHGTVTALGLVIGILTPIITFYQ
jgi:hypothetical protein